MIELSTDDLISKMQALKVILSVHEGRLRINAPDGVITPELHSELAARKSELLTILQESAIETPQPEAIPRVSRNDELPLSFAQQRLWFLGQIEGASAAYHIPMCFRLKGTLDRSALRRALDRILARHEALRTTFPLINGAPAQRFAPVENSRFPLVEHDLRQQSDANAELDRLAEREAGASFDLEAGPLIRGRLIQISENEHALLITMHHIVSDGWSMDVLIKELSALYGAFVRGEDDPLPELEIQYADYSVWQRKWLADDVQKQQAAHWKKALAGAPALLELPTDRPRPPQQNYAGAFAEFALGEQLTSQLKEFGRRHSSTLFMILFAAWAALLARLSGQEDVLVGTPAANRGRKEIENLIGFFVSTLVIRLNLSDSPTVSQLVKQVKAQVMAAQQHQDIAFEQVVELARPVRSMAHNPLFQVMFAWQGGGPGGLELPGLELQPSSTPRRTAKFDLVLELQESDNTISGGIEYATSLFEPSTIERYIGYFRNLLRGMVADDTQAIDRVPILPQSERHQLLQEWNEPQSEFPPDKCVHRLFEEQVARNPEAVALVFEGASLSYAELNRRANQLAHYLHELGVKPDARVAICVERSLEMVISLLAVLKAGGTYVPLDPVYPAERLGFILQDSAPMALLTQGHLRGLFTDIGDRFPVLDMTAATPAWHGQPESNIDPSDVGVKPNHLGYIIYTSGSTGQPKGVMVEHANIARLFAATDQWFHFGAHDVWTLFHSFAFDFSVWEIWGALLYGGRLVVVPKDTARSPVDFYKLLCEQKVTVLNQTPSAFRQLIAAQANHPEAHKLRYVIFGGEALELATLKPWYEQNRKQPTQLINMYGITETTVHVTYRPLEQRDAERRGASPIGCRIPDLRTYILDAYGQPVPVGVVGELYVGGAGVARGYLNRPELTTERFLADPFSPRPGARMYRSGDLCRWLADGTMEYLGRNDFQVKIRGFRIELGEIETRLAEHPAVREAAVIAREDTPGDKRLVAYYTSAPSNTPGAESAGAEQFRKHLSANLPAYMVPAAYVHMESLPLTSNGKLNRKALPAPEADAFATRGHEPPQGELEATLAGIWARVLKLDRVGRHDNFFELGGHSLLAVSIAFEVEKRTKLRLPLAAFLQAPTIADLAEVLQKAHWTPSWSSLVPLRASGSKPPLFLMHAHGGNVLEYYSLTDLLPPDQPVYALQARGLDGNIPSDLTIEKMASNYIEEMRSLQPEGPYFVAGFCFGGLLALEAAQQLTAAGQEVALLTLIQSINPQTSDLKQPGPIRRRWSQIIKRADLELENRSAAGKGYLLKRFVRSWDMIHARAEIALDRTKGKRRSDLGRGSKLYVFEALGIEHRKAWEKYVARPYKGDALLIRASKQLAWHAGDEYMGWGSIFVGNVDLCEVPGHQQNILLKPNVKKLAATLAVRLEAAQQRNEVDQKKAMSAL